MTSQVIIHVKKKRRKKSPLALFCVLYDYMLSVLFCLIITPRLPIPSGFPILPPVNVEIHITQEYPSG
jgi:hypothetical protein